MQFKVDENLPAEIADVLRANGHDALDDSRAEPRGSPDGTIAHVCRDEARVLVTLDMDFANIHAYPPEKHAGIIVLRLTLQDKPHVLEVFRSVLSALFERAGGQASVDRRRRRHSYSSVAGEKVASAWIRWRRTSLAHRCRRHQRDHLFFRREVIKKEDVGEDSSVRKRKTYLSLLALDSFARISRETSVARYGSGSGANVKPERNQPFFWRSSIRHHYHGPKSETTKSRKPSPRFLRLDPSAEHPQPARNRTAGHAGHTGGLSLRVHLPENLS